MTATSISANRLRMITSQYSAPAVEAAAFDPIAPGGVDHFAYDLSADAGAAQMIETTWTCTFDAGESDAVDEDPQARIIEAWITNSIAVSPSADSEANPRPRPPFLRNGCVIAIPSRTVADRGWRVRGLRRDSSSRHANRGHIQ